MRFFPVDQFTPFQDPADPPGSNDLPLVGSDLLHKLISRHHELTQSKRAEAILNNWRQMVGRFVKVIPIDYRQALERLAEREQRQAEFTPATEEVYDG